MILLIFFCNFYFCKQKAAYDMRISDWSSDVCSSDLQTDCVQTVRDSGQLPDLKAVVVVGDGDAGDYMRWDDFEGLAATANWPGLAADDPAFMVYLSGTTADPKSVLHSPNSLLADVCHSYPDNDPASRLMSPERQSTPLTATQ